MNTEQVGKLYAFVGVDGSGKSSTSKIIYEELKSKGFKARKVYLGSGDGKVPISVKIIDFFKKTIKFLLRYKSNENKRHEKKDNLKDTTIRFFRSPIRYLSLFLQAIKIYSISKSNLKKLQKANVLRLSGIISIFDRFPQIQQKSINDGPKIDTYATILNNKYLRILSKHEYEYLKKCTEIKPNIIFRLNVLPEVALNRKKEHDNLEYLETKSNLLSQIVYNTCTIEINANKPQNEVIQDIMNHIIEDLGEKDGR